MPGGLRRLALALVLFLAIGSLDVIAQPTVETVSNAFIKAHVTTPQRAGRFWITARDSIKFLYMSSTSFVTSNIVFRISRGTSVNYYCNQPEGLFPWRPTSGTNAAVFRPYDTMIVRPDTLLMEWRGLSGFDVTLRIIAEKPTTIYDSGTDLLFEFSYKLQPYAPAAQLGILMMLDTYNSQAGALGGGGAGDQPSVATSNGYMEVNTNQNNRRFTAIDMPKWYHVGNFLYNEPLNNIFPIHRLTGTSHGGMALTRPDMLAIGNWYMFRNVAWDLPSDFSSSGFGDCATIVRWEGLTSEGTIRTAFGLSDKEGNSNFTCRDDQIFVDIHAPRLITQAVKNGPYSLDEFDVELWASNTSQTVAASPTIRLVTPIDALPSFPLPSDRLILDTRVTSADTTVFIPPRGTVKMRWRLKVNPLSKDTLARLRFLRRYGSASWSAFIEPCTPQITIKGWQEPAPPPDTLAPRIEPIDAGRGASVYWTFNIYDRHPGYRWDTGLTYPIEVLASENVNYAFTPARYTPCDTNETVALAVTVIDTSRPANLTIRAMDCAGNDTIATVVHAPRPDTFPPEVVIVQQSGSYGPPCNTRHYELTLLDQNHQTATHGDHGFGTAVVIDSSNFRVNVNGGVPIRPFDKRATIVADVIDSMRDGRLVIFVVDFAGNATTISYAYCTLPDVLPPVSVVTPLSNGRWEVTTSDRRAWDRGLREVRELDNPGANMRVPFPPVINPGDLLATFEVEAIDVTQRGEIVLEVRDTIYATEPAGHADTIRIVHMPSAQPRDTIAPDISFVPVAGSNGASVTAEVDEIHFINGIRYPYDTGLESVWVQSATPNIQLSSAISFVAGDTITSFGIRVIDTLAIGIRDTIVIAARDGAGNVNTGTYIYPIQPDTKPPIIIGTMDVDRTSLTAVVSDARPYDRGLGTLTLEDESNIALRGAMPNLRGRLSDTVRFDVADPDAPVAATLVLSDLVATIDQTPEGSADHIVRVPFTLPSVALEIALPAKVEGGESVTAAIIARTPIGDDVDSLGFQVSHTNADGDPDFAWRISRVAVARIGVDVVDVTIMPDVLVNPGDTIGTMTFATRMTGSVYDLRLSISNARVNGGLGHVVTARVGSDDELSVISLPPALIRITGDSVTYVNGDCERILTGTRPLAKPDALAILGVRPQPVVRSGSAALELDLRNLPNGGAIAELVAVDGSTTAIVTIDGSTERLARRLVSLPDVAPGTYLLRLSASSGIDQVMISIVE